MLRQHSPSINSEQNKHNTPVEVSETGSSSVDIQQELNQLEEIILSSPHIPLTRRTLVDEEKLLEHLDFVRLHLPAAFGQAEKIIRHQEEIFLEAEQQAREIVEAAQARAAQSLNETEIFRQAELEANRLRQQVQHDCDAVLEQTLADVEKTRRQAQQELDEMRSKTIAECTQIQQGADQYADGVLKNIEQQLNDMLRVIRNGRQQLRE